MTRAQETVGSFALGLLQWRCARTALGTALHRRLRGRPRLKIIQADHLSEMYVQTSFGEWRVS